MYFDLEQKQADEAKMTKPQFWEDESPLVKKKPTPSAG